MGRGLGIAEILAPKLGEIEQVARKYGARDLRVFGSVARNQARADSDVDLLVEFTGKWRGPKSRLYLMQHELESLLGRRVDLVQEKNLHWFIEPQIVAEAVPL